MHTTDEAAEEMERLLRQPTISIVEAGRVLGRDKNAAYRAANSGHLPTIIVGKTRRVPTAKLKALLGMQGSAA